MIWQISKNKKFGMPNFFEGSKKPLKQEAREAGEEQMPIRSRRKTSQTLAKQVDFLPVLKGGDSLNHAVSWFKGGSH